MKRTIAVILASVAVFSFFCYASAEDKKGASEMILDGGSKGEIAFPHSRHQNTLGTCGSCHNLFPKRTGSIQELISTGKIAKKQTMNQCRDCHREMKKAGKATGPTSCKKCHNKELKK